MKTVIDNARISFQIQFQTLKAITGKSNADIAKMLGCGVSTVSKMANDPLSVSGTYILLIQEYLKKAERERYGNV